MNIMTTYNGSEICYFTKNIVKRNGNILTAVESKLHETILPQCNSIRNSGPQSQSREHVDDRYEVKSTCLDNNK